MYCDISILRYKHSSKSENMSILRCLHCLKLIITNDYSQIMVNVTKNHFTFTYCGKYHHIRKFLFEYLIT